MSLLHQPPAGRARTACASTETRDPIGYLVAALNRLAQTDLLDRLGLRKQAEQTVFTVTSSGFPTITAASRQFARSGLERGKPGVRAPGVSAPRHLRPDADRGRADARRRGHRVRRRGRPAGRRGRRRRLRGARSSCSRRASRSGCRSSASRRRSAASPRSARRWPARSSPRRSPRATWAWPSPRSRPARSPPRIGLWGTEEQQQTYLPAFTGERATCPAAALALDEPTVLFDVLTPGDHRDAGPATASCSTA